MKVITFIFRGRWSKNRRKEKSM